MERHFDVPNNHSFQLLFKVKELPDERDPFFKSLSFEEIDKQICQFFVKMIKKYQDLLIKKVRAPIIFVLEDCHNIDDVNKAIMLDFI